MAKGGADKDKQMAGCQLVKNADVEEIARWQFQRSGNSFRGSPKGSKASKGPKLTKEERKAAAKQKAKGKKK